MGKYINHNYLNCQFLPQARKFYLPLLYPLLYFSCLLLSVFLFVSLLSLSHSPLFLYTNFELSFESFVYTSAVSTWGLSPLGVLTLWENV